MAYSRWMRDLPPFGVWHFPRFQQGGFAATIITCGLSKLRGKLRAKSASAERLACNFPNVGTVSHWHHPRVLLAIKNLNITVASGTVAGRVARAIGKVRNSMRALGVQW